MDERDPPTSSVSLLQSAISTLGEVYARIEREQATFLSSAAAAGSPIVCPQGCGLCCEPFVPDITAAEAAFAASWIIANKPELAAEVASWEANGGPDAPPCPFYRRSTPEAHCSIYPARFLVCRLFYASAVRDKEGRAAFRPCAHMSLVAFPRLGGERPSLAGEELARVFGAEPPIMADYSAQVVALFPSESGETALVTEAMPKAVARVGLTLSLAGAAKDRPYWKRE